MLDFSLDMMLLLTSCVMLRFCLECKKKLIWFMNFRFWNIVMWGILGLGDEWLKIHTLLMILVLV